MSTCMSDFPTISLSPEKNHSQPNLCSLLYTTQMWNESGPVSPEQGHVGDLANSGQSTYLAWEAIKCPGPFAPCHGNHGASHSSDLI